MNEFPLMVKVTQQAQVHHILNTVMGKKPCSLLVGDAEHPAGFISYNLLTSGPELKIRTQFLDSPTERRVLVRHNKKRIIAVCKFVLRNGPTEILYPQALEITDDVRKDIAETGSATGYFMTNLTSAKEIAFVIESNKKKVNGFVINFFDSELKNLVPYHKIFFASGESSDIRLKHLVKNPRIIYYSPEPPANFKPRQYFPQDVYLEEIQKSDLKVPSNLKAEFTIPILYKTKLPIGYIQVNMPRFIDEVIIQTIKKIGVALETQLRKIGLVFEEARPLPVFQINMKQVELEITDRLLLRHFQPGLIDLFRIQKGQESLGQFSAVVSASKNLGGGKTHVTLEFQDMDAMSELNLEEALK
ncbi:MAG: hypothetical protein JNJ69_06695 [Leptospiraceae bacterium]|nr:hypothetical protein [Leptospiraceae bacterium]